MNPNDVISLIRTGLAKYDPCYFGAAVDAHKRKLRDAVLSEIRRITTRTCRDLPDSPITSLLWKVRATLATVAQSRSPAVDGLFLQRAAAGIWTMAMHMERETAQTKPPTGVSRTGKKATPEDAAAHLRALQQFAAELNRLNLDPASLPVGETAVAEARALCVVRALVERRYLELRRWVHPQAVVEECEGGYSEFNADNGERLILQYHKSFAIADSSDPRAWTWRGQDTAEYSIGDLLCDLQHAADALGISWDDADGMGDWHHGEAIKEDTLAKT
ncbi:MAG: hypothetical protein ABSH20_03365 [Tepidisphaeraceae bacterium]|jgi:hypothetical protein